MPFVRQLDLAPLVAIRAGEAALDVTEQLRLEERFGHAGAVHGHERRRLAGRLLVDESRHHVLADAALAGDEHLGRAFCRPFGDLQQVGHGAAGNDESVV